MSGYKVLIDGVYIDLADYCPNFESKENQKRELDNYYYIDNDQNKLFTAVEKHPTDTWVKGYRPPFNRLPTTTPTFCVAGYKPQFYNSNLDKSNLLIELTPLQTSYTTYGRSGVALAIENNKLIIKAGSKTIWQMAPSEFKDGVLPKRLIVLLQGGGGGGMASGSTLAGAGGGGGGFAAIILNTEKIIAANTCYILKAGSGGNGGTGLNGAGKNGTFSRILFGFTNNSTNLILVAANGGKGGYGESNQMIPGGDVVFSSAYINDYYFTTNDDYSATGGGGGYGGSNGGSTPYIGGLRATNNLADNVAANILELPYTSGGSVSGSSSGGGGGSSVFGSGGDIGYQGTGGNGGEGAGGGGGGWKSVFEAGNGGKGGDGFIEIYY